jgi:hypothetical protein
MDTEYAVFINGEFAFSIKSRVGVNIGTLGLKALETYTGQETIHTMDIYPKWPYRAWRYEEPKLEGNLLVRQKAFYEIRYDAKKA